MATDGDVARLRWHYATFNAGDVEACVQTVTVDIRVQMDPGLQLVFGEVNGHAELRTMFEEMTDVLGGLRTDPLEFVELGDRVMVPVRVSGRAENADLAAAQDLVHVWTLRDGMPARADFEANRPPAWASPEPGQPPV
jgi:ketosteroid isomerase-like protein